MPIALTFQLSASNSSSKPWHIQNYEFRPVQKEGRLWALYLLCQVDWEQYQHVESQQLFNLKPGIRGIDEGSPLLPGKTVTLELLLNPDHLNSVPSSLLPYLNQDEFNHHWQGLAEQEPQAVLIQTESWYLQAAVQRQGSALVGYRTLWNYLDADMLRSDFQVSPQLFARINDFIKQSALAQDTLADYDDTSLEKLLEQSADFLQSAIAALSNLSNKNPNQCPNPQAILDEMVENVVKLAVKTMPSTIDEDYQTSLLRTVMAFLVNEEIEFEHNVAKSVLRFRHTGQHGEWECYAKTQEESRVFIFYSIPTFQVPPDKLAEVAYYICQANYGLVMGNLEMDVTDGEIRYKTSIDVEGDSLSLEMVRNMVYANLNLMDCYLPGLMAILDQGKSVAEAIALVGV